MSTPALFITLLENSRTDQQKISIVLSHNSFNGLVSSLTPEVVELRTDDGKRSFIALDHITAIVTV